MSCPAHAHAGRDSPTTVAARQGTLAALLQTLLDSTPDLSRYPSRKCSKPTCARCVPTAEFSIPSQTDERPPSMTDSNTDSNTDTDTNTSTKCAALYTAHHGRN
ncbi:hypothetical protein CIB48_g816 [Xylaria polymorpha]|nr:hypothetical protein CIB48_g816 [Xylaria polymorpha]